VDPLGTRDVRSWSLDIGAAFRGSVVRQDKAAQATTRLASVNVIRSSPKPCSYVSACSACIPCR
jgi:hypothetical protein